MYLDTQKGVCLQCEDVLVNSFKGLHSLPPLSRPIGACHWSPALSLKLRFGVPGSLVYQRHNIGGAARIIFGPFVLRVSEK